MSSCQDNSPNGGDLTDDQETIMKFAIGRKTCSDDDSSRFIGFIILTIIITFLFVLLNTSAFDSICSTQMSNYNYRLACKAFIFFFLVLIVIWAASKFQEEQEKNGRKNKCK